MFEAAFVISLPFRQDRLESFHVQSQYIKSLPEIKVWPAVHGDTCRAPDFWTAGDGAWGCYRSHMNILEHCLNNGISSYVVFEDDAQIKPEFDSMLKSFMDSLPEDWQQIYLGGQLQHAHNQPPIPVNEHVLRPFNVNRTHCFAVSRDGMLPIYRHISNLPFATAEHIDHHLGRWHEHPKTAVYCPNQWLVGQMGSSSNVSGKNEPVEFFTDPQQYKLNHWLMNKPLCIYYRGSFDLLRQCRSYLHAGNQVDAHGFDITLSLAAKYAEPAPEIIRWYHWIRTEIIRGNSQALPCFFHPKIPLQVVQDALNCRIVEASPTTIQEVKDLIEKIKDENLYT